MMRLQKLITTSLIAFTAFDMTEAARKVLVNGRFYTVDESNPWADAVAINSNGILEAIGSEREIIDQYGNGADVEIMDLGGRLVLPGFHDVHIHAAEAGIFRELCYIPELTRMTRVPSILRNCPAQGRFGDQGWIMAAGISLDEVLIQLDFNPRERYPAEILDAAFPNIPVLILDSLGHGAIANTEALRRVGYDTLREDPLGGTILRGRNNVPIGIVMENAQQRLRDAAFPPTRANQNVAYDSLLRTLRMLNKNGITSVSDAGGYWRQAQTESWDRALREGELTVRASNALYVYPDDPIEEQLPELLMRFSNDPNSLLRFNQAKVYVDGILSLGTAALYQPYLAASGLPPQERLGFEYFGNAAYLNTVSQLLVDSGFQLHYHVAGDRAVGLALDAIESSVSILPSSVPHRLTHCFLVDSRDRNRFSELGVFADFQLAPSTTSRGFVRSLQRHFIGRRRARALSPALELHRAGATITVSSDWDADPMSPLAKIETILTRSPSKRTFQNVETIIPMMTLDAAKLLQHDDKTGSIQVGKFADLVVLDRNIFEIPASQISEARVTMTMLQGEIVYVGSSA